MTTETQIQKLNGMKGSLEYVGKVLEKPIEKWERKEYLTLKQEYEEQIRKLSFHINANFEIFGVAV